MRPFPALAIRSILLLAGAALPLRQAGSAQAAPSPAITIQAQPFLNGIESPTAFTDDGSGRLFITEQTGRIRIAVNGQLRKEPFLDISNEVKSGGERGLLCVVFHPKFAENGRFFVNYTTEKNGSLETVVAEFKAGASDLKADPKTEKEILRFHQPYSNHNGGQLAFGPDGMLYIAVGDGGSGGDPQQNGQNLKTWLGKILRIDINGSQPGKAYAVPADNPFVATPEAKPEIWAYGLRNPWRFSFDLKTGQLWAGDVGQNKWEEIDIIEKGKNYGWSAREGMHDFRPERAAGALIDPVKDYGRDLGQSVTGGYVYRGKEFPALDGLYLYGDFATGRVWGLRCEGNGKPVTFDAELAKFPFTISAFGEDRHGELYILDYGGGKVLKLVQ